MPKVVKEMFNTTIAQQLEQLIADMQRKVEIKGESKPTPKSFLTENVQHADSSIDLDAGEEDEVTPTPKSQHTCQVSRGYMDGIDLRPTGLKQAVHSRNEPPVTVKGEFSVKPFKASPIKFTPKGAKKSVRMVRDEAAPNNSLLQPILTQLCGEMAKPTFNGDPENWPQLLRAWEEYIAFVASLNGKGTLPDTVLLQLLKISLDETTKMVLKRRMEEDPYITFDQFWGEIQTEFEGDLHYKYRSAWEKVTLEGKPRLTSHAWRKFCTAFELAKSRVEDRTEREEYNLIFKQLPEDWRLQVVKEEAKRRRNKFWVKFTNVMEYSPQDIENTIKDINGVKVRQLEPTTHGYFVECGNEPNRQKLLLLDGGQFNDKDIRVVKVDKK